MTFVAQFCFADSRGIIGDTPGDVLLLFAESDEAYLDSTGAPEGFFHFEWYPLGLTDLVDTSGLKEPAWRFVTCYGVRHRTVDYTDPRALEVCEEIVRKEFPEQWAPECASRLCHIPGIKIGGIPAWRQFDEAHSDSDLPGKFLCSLTAILTADGPYPWVNESDPTGDDFYNDELTLKFGGDDSIINFSLDDRAQMHWYC